MSDVDLHTVTYNVRALEWRVERLESEYKKELERRTERAKARADRSARKTEHLFVGIWFVFALLAAVSITIVVTKAVVAP